MLTPHFAGCFGYRGPVLHIAPHPLPTCCRSLKRDGEDEACKTRKENDFFCFLQHASVTSSSAPLLPLHVSPAHFCKMGLNWLISFFHFPMSIIPGPTSLSFSCLSLLFFARSLTALVRIWLPPYSPLTIFTITREYCFAIVLNNGDWFPFTAKNGNYYWLISQ